MSAPVLLTRRLFRRGAQADVARRGIHWMLDRAAVAIRRKSSLGYHQHRMRRVPALKSLAARAVSMIRHEGWAVFLRRSFSVRRWARIVRRTDAFAAGGDVVGTIDLPLDAISRATGGISGWALSRSGRIDRVEIFIDGRAIGYAALCMPRTDIEADLPEARVCGFHINIDPEQLPAADTMDVGFTVHLMSGEVHAFPARPLPLRADTNIDSSASSPRSAPPPATRRAERKIRIACFAHDLGYGGGQLYLQELLRQFAARAQVDCVVCSPSDGPLHRELTSLGFAVEIIPEPPRMHVDRHDQATHALGTWLLRQQFDCVLANTLSGFYAVNAAHDVRVPSLWAIHESFPLSTWSGFYTQERPGSEFLLARIKTALSCCSAVIFEAEATRQMFLAYGREDRFLKIPYGIDVSTIDRFLQTFDRGEARASLGISPKSQALLCMGTVERRKQQIFLAQAFAEILTEHRDAELLLVGDYPSSYSTTLHQYLEEKGLGRGIRVIPVAPDPYPWYALADGFVLLSALESMPRSMLEAMAFGLPVLASRVFGIPELVDDGTSGLLIEPNSLRSAVEGLHKLLSLSDNEHSSMARAAREKITRDHDSHGYAEKYLALIRRLAT